MHGYFCIGFINFMLKSKSLLDYTNLFSPNKYERYCVIYGKYRNFEKPKISYLLEKTLVLSNICSKCKNKDEKIFKEEEPIDILGLIENI